MKRKLALYALALIGLIWVVIWGYWSFFKLKLWLSGFGTGIFWVLGLLSGFVYFYLAHKIQGRIAGTPELWKKAGYYGAFGLGLLFVNPLSLSLALWLFTPPGSLNSIGEWFFFGCLLGAALILGMERLFAPKKNVKKP